MHLVSTRFTYGYKTRVPIHQRDTHRNDEVVFCLQFMTQGQHKALCVLLTVANQKHPAESDTQNK